MNPLSQTLIIAGGVYHLCFVAFHLCFWKLFAWKQDLRRTQPVNRGIMQVMNLCLIFIFLATAYLSFLWQAELLLSGLGHALLLLIAAFWLLRAIEQAIFFDSRKPLSLLLMLIFLIGSALYLMPGYFLM